MIGPDFFLFVFFGCIIGFLAGLFGVGGGGLIVPLLVFSYEHSGVSPSVLTHIAMGTSLFVILFASVTSAYQHGKQGNVHGRAAVVIGGSSALTGFATAGLAVHLSGKHLRIAFAALTILIAVRMLTEKATSDEKRSAAPSEVNMIPLIGIGLAAGIISALAGVGGGGVTIPLMYYLLNMPLKLAIGTSSATMVITALFAVTGYIVHGVGRPDLLPWSLGFIDLLRGSALVIGSIGTARVGAYVSFKTHAYTLRKLFAVFLSLVAIYMVVG